MTGTMSTKEQIALLNKIRAMGRTGKIILETTKKLTKREIANGGRCCELVLRKTSEKVLVRREGFGPFRKPEFDEHVVYIYHTYNDNGDYITKKQGDFNSLYEVAQWLVERGC